MKTWFYFILFRYEDSSGERLFGPGREHTTGYSELEETVPSDGIMLPVGFWSDATHGQSGTIHCAIVRLECMGKHSYTAAGMRSLGMLPLIRSQPNNRHTESEKVAKLQAHQFAFATMLDSFEEAARDGSLMRVRLADGTTKVIKVYPRLTAILADLEEGHKNLVIKPGHCLRLLFWKQINPICLTLVQYSVAYLPIRSPRGKCLTRPTKPTKAAANFSAAQEDEHSEDGNSEESSDDDDDANGDSSDRCSSMFSLSPNDRCSAKPRRPQETRALRVSFFR